MRVTNSLEILSHNGSQHFCCSRCNHVYGPATDNVKEFAKMKSFPITKAGPMLNPWSEQPDFEVREFYCPSCATMISVELNKKEAPILWDIALA